ncbi:MAG: hypothetical protein IJX49_03720 [Clostridia bacterium]|nr:hypothetical protein [Clostridia bacterium]
MYILYSFTDGEWGQFAAFDDSADFASQVRKSAEIKKNTSLTDSARNAAIVMEGFVLSKKSYGEQYGKLVKRALRHFDEVGLSNDIYDSLEELLDEGCDAFALAKDGEDVASFPKGSFDVQI